MTSNADIVIMSILSALVLRSLFIIFNVATTIKKYSRKFILIKHRIFDLCYDALYRIETFKKRELNTLQINFKNKRFGKAYQGTPYLVLNKLFSRLSNFDFANSTFVDFGSGKGRVLLIAAKHGFSKVIGVEISEELCRKAAKNLSGFSKDVDIKIENNDASQFPIPKENCIYYLYNPFSKEIIEQLLNNIKQTKSKNNQEIFVYANPIHHKVFIENNYKLIDRIDCRNHNYIVNFYQ